VDKEAAMQHFQHWFQPRTPLRRWRGFVSALAAVAQIGAGCSTATNNDVASKSSEAQEQLPAIEVILEHWSAGEHAHAIELLVEAAEDGRDLRAFHLSESAFIALPEQERTAAHAAKIARAETLGAIARSVRSAARSAAEQGNQEQADRLAGALKAVGEANTGNDLTQLANLVGEAILRASADAEAVASRP
jgi:hypothetical protein